MAWRGTELLHRPRGGPDWSIMHEDIETGIGINYSEEISAKGVLNDAAPCDKEKISKDHSGAPIRFCDRLKQISAKIWNTLSTSQKKLPAKVIKLEKELKEKATQIDSLNRSRTAEVQCLKSIIKEREKALAYEKLHSSQLKSKCQKLEAQLSLIQQKTAQES